MVDSEKGDFSTGKAKTKGSLLDDDFSKDFLSSWKPTSAKGGDDMDFNFEPVSKGKKKAFDFGMISDIQHTVVLIPRDMDFSLDDAFGKISSFKMDMSDLDFSSSPKKSSKSKDKLGEDPAKGDGQDKHDKFFFSFDFNGLDDFNLDSPSTKGGKSPSSLKKSKEDASKCEDFHKRVTNDKEETTEETITKGPPVCDNETFLKSEDSVVGDGNPNTASSKAELTHPVEPKETQMSADKLLPENTRKTDHQIDQEGDFSSKKSCSPGNENNLGPIPVKTPAQSISSQLPFESEEVNVCSGTEITMTALSIDDEIKLKKETTSNKPFTHLKEMDLPTDTSLIEASNQVNDISTETEISSPERKLDDGISESGTGIGELKAAIVFIPDAEKVALDKPSLQCSMEEMNIKEENNELGDDSLGTAKLPLDIIHIPTTSDANPLSLSAPSKAEKEKPSLKVFSAPVRSELTAAKTMLPRKKIPEVMNSKFPIIKVTSNDGRAGLTDIEDNGKGSTVDRSSELKGKKVDENPSSCTIELINQTSVLEKSEKNSAACTASRSEVSVVNAPSNGKGSKDVPPSLECEKMINNVRYSGFKIPSSAPPGQGTKIGNQGQGKPKDKITSLASIQKLCISQGNKISSQRIDKKMPAIPSMKLTRSTTINKLPMTPTMQANAKSLEKFEKSTRLQAMIKKVSPVPAEKQTSSTPSLKRKPSEAADISLEKLQTTKRVSPSGSSISKVSAKEREDEAQTRGNILEGSKKNVVEEYMTPKFNFDQEANVEALQFSLLMDNDENVAKAEACAKELDNICNMLKKKHEEAKELLVRALVNNNNLLMLNHPIYDEKIRAVQKFASKLMSKEQEVEA